MEPEIRTRSILLTLAMLLTLLVAAPASADEGLDRLSNSFATPLLVTAPEGDERVFVVEREGIIRVVDDLGDGTKRTFTDLTDLISTTGEGGLLGLAFSPDFDSDGRLWVQYTNTSGDTRVDRLQANDARTRAPASSRVNVLSVDQPQSNHNGGMIAFADDGMLLVGLGDGGGANDPGENAQDTSTLLGSILRLDVKDRSGGGYAIPDDNPLVDRPGARGEIWAYGLRNPYRFSVDRATGDVWIGDVGQDRREEVDRLAYPGPRVYNLGWDRYEGSLLLEGPSDRTGLTFPVHEYNTGSDGRCSITGGYVVRDPGAASLQGDYLFGDFCGGGVRVYDAQTDDTRRLAGGGVGRIYGFGQDGVGNVYVTTGNRVYRVEASGTSFSDVGDSDVFANDIEALAAAGVTKGCNPPANDQFCPSEPVTRAQMAAFITRAANYTRQAEPFRDVSSGNIFAGDIGAIADAGVTKGCNPPANDRFCPDVTVSRAQMAAFLTRAAGLTRQSEPFRDVSSGNIFAGDIGAIADAGITKGCNPPANDRYCPDDTVTREQMAAFLVRAFDL